MVHSKFYQIFWNNNGFWCWQKCCAFCLLNFGNWSKQKQKNNSPEYTLFKCDIILASGGNICETAVAIVALLHIRAWQTLSTMILKCNIHIVYCNMQKHFIVFCTSVAWLYVWRCVNMFCNVNVNVVQCTTYYYNSMLYIAHCIL